ncbi:hypothetical protein LTR85_002409 [Meristemomyces frigidus]|nr:hypothetical protein LTR85_002409 [Meristemomyces frigidus]
MLYRLFPLLTEHFTIVAPGLRGFGYTDKPPATDGYDSKTNAEDMADLMTQLGHEEFYLHGEDRGADYAYAVAHTVLKQDAWVGLILWSNVLQGKR